MGPHVTLYISDRNLHISGSPGFDTQSFITLLWQVFRDILFGELYITEMFFLVDLVKSVLHR